MKKFRLKASLLAGLSHTINSLSPEQKGKVQVNAVAGNRLCNKIVDDLEEANAPFLKATKETSDKLMKRFEELKAEAEKESEGKSEQDLANSYRAKTVQYKKEAEEINKASEAKPDEMVEVQMSDVKMIALVEAYPATVSQWQDSRAFVEVADALDGASEA